MVKISEARKILFHPNAHEILLFVIKANLSWSIILMKTKKVISAKTKVTPFYFFNGYGINLNVCIFLTLGSNPDLL